MRKPVLIAAAVVVIAAAALLIWRPWEPSTTHLTDLVVSSEMRGYRVDGHDLIQSGEVEGASVSADLGGRFANFDASVSLRGRPAGSKMQVQISLDGNVEYEAEVVAGEPPHPVKLTIAGVKKITLSGGTGASLAVELVWSEPRVS